MMNANLALLERAQIAPVVARTRRAPARRKKVESN